MDSLSVFLCFLYLTQCFTKLVRTGSGTVAATDSFQLIDNLIDFHSLDQFSDSLQVAITSSPKVKFGNDSVFYLKLDVATACSLRLVSEFLYNYSSSSAGFMFV